MVKSIKEIHIVFKHELINLDESTASVYSVSSAKPVIIIPRLITYNSKEYKVTAILPFSISNLGKVKSIQFPEDSELLTIKSNAINNCTLTSISLPSSVCELEDRWIQNMPELKEIKISPQNPYFQSYENHFILSKSNKDNDNYDNLILTVLDKKNVTIPDFVEIIGPYSFYKQRLINSIQFSENSKLRKIEKNAFNLSSIEIIKIPATVVELKKGWTNGARNLKKIEVDSKNPLFQLYENKIIIGKSSIEKDNFDVLVFAEPDITELTIPDFIEIIGSHSFKNYEFIEKVDFTPNSKLRVIEEHAFSGSSIKKISLPASLIEIQESAFSNCENLQNVEIDENSKLENIGRYAFSSTSIEEFYIPEKIKIIKEGTFSQCNNLHNIKFCKENNVEEIEGLSFESTPIKEFYIGPKVNEINGSCFKNTYELIKIDIDENNTKYIKYDNKVILSKSTKEETNYDFLLISERDITNFTIPTYITNIGSYSFNDCSKLKEIIIPTDSKLQIIGDFSFSRSSIESISFPSQLTTICDSAFSECNQLTKITIPQNNSLNVIEKYAFHKTSIRDFSLPSQITQISKDTFSECSNLRSVRIPYNSKLQKICENAFIGTSIQSISIPSKVLYIGHSAFESCKNLRSVSFPYNSELKIMEFNCFICTSIEKILIPSQITRLYFNTFYGNQKLKCVVFQEGSLLQKIDNTFSYSGIQCFCFPPKLRKLNINAFFECRNIKIIELNDYFDINNFVSNYLKEYNVNVIIMVPSK